MWLTVEFADNNSFQSWPSRIGSLVSEQYWEISKFIYDYSLITYGIVLKADILTCAYQLLALLWHALYTQRVWISCSPASVSNCFALSRRNS